MPFRSGGAEVPPGLPSPMIPIGRYRLYAFQSLLLHHHQAGQEKDKSGFSGSFPTVLELPDGSAQSSRGCRTRRPPFGLLLSAFKNLPAHQEKAVKMCFEQDMTYADIAAEFGSFAGHHLQMGLRTPWRDSGKLWAITVPNRAAGHYHFTNHCCLQSRSLQIVGPKLLWNTPSALTTQWLPRRPALLSASQQSTLILIPQSTAHDAAECHLAG